MKPIRTTVTVAGKKIVFETGRIARQANGAVLAQMGETIVLSTACASSEPLPDIDFLPLRVDYQEKFSSVGKTLSGYIKREGKPTEKETLVSRLIDRPIRPMIKEGYHHDVQLLNYVLSYDNLNSPDVLAICASSAALCLSDIPLIKPIGAVRVGCVDSKFIINPTPDEMKRSKLDLVMAGTEDAVLMIEGSCDFLTEEAILQAIEAGHSAIKDICSCLHAFQKEYGKEKKLDTIHTVSDDTIHLVKEMAQPMLVQASATTKKQERDRIISDGSKIIIDELTRPDRIPAYPKLDVKKALEIVSSEFMRQQILDTGYRWDGRSTTQIRNIDVDQGLLPRAHGSSLFTRGETQSLAICVLGSEQMALRFEDLHGENNSRFYMQYFFPPFSVGEVGRIGAPGRREVGHGKLAEKALAAVVPTKETFPYTIRLESNITESNGSSSMASVCGGCLAMMDAGVPLKSPVSGIAMGLILEKNRYAILSDILGVEDALGDMDFKVAGDREGITAFQMDIKIEGITIDVMRQALHQAKEGRIHILEKMLETCPKAKTEMSIYAPRIETIKVKPSKIGLVIGPGGKQIRTIIEQTGAQIDISDDGTVSISSPSVDKLEKAKEIIYGLTAEAEIGKVYQGKIVSAVQFGLFVEIIPGKEGLCHISELDVARVESIESFLKQQNLSIGDSLPVMVLDINERGQLKLSRKAVTKCSTSSCEK